MKNAKKRKKNPTKASKLIKKALYVGKWRSFSMYLLVFFSVLIHKNYNKLEN